MTRYLTPEETCEVLGVTNRTLQRYASAGMLTRYTSWDGRRVYLESQVRRFRRPAIGRPVST
jgi:excisionase family DNA binding protein